MFPGCIVVVWVHALLQVWNGTQKQSDHVLLDTPVAITSFISETAAPRLPSLAVAAGETVLECLAWPGSTQTAAAVKKLACMLQVGLSMQPL